MPFPGIAEKYRCKLSSVSSFPIVRVYDHAVRFKEGIPALSFRFPDHIDVRVARRGAAIVWRGIGDQPRQVLASAIAREQLVLLD
jgi:hypothetical protein